MGRKATIAEIDIRSNEAKIINVAAAREIVASFDCRVQVEILSGYRGKRGAISFEAYDWPTAIRTSELPQEADFPTATKRCNATDSLHRQRGEEGFEGLLLNLAPCLGSVLTIQALCTDAQGNLRRVKEWKVDPGATSLKVQDIELIAQN